MQQRMLRIPGPTPLPERVVRSSTRPMIGHRSAEFTPLLAECVEGLQWAMRTSNDVLLFPSSGTGALEASVVNLLSPGEEVLFCTMGWFGEVWARIASAFGARVRRLTAPWGSPIEPMAIADVLRQQPAIQKVFVTHNETSTGVTNDMRAIAAVVKGRGRLLVVDSISGAGCLPLEVDALGLDVVITGSQKGWMAPPGLSMLAVSQAALVASMDARCPRWYFDFHWQKRDQDKGSMHTTPPISVMYALQEGLRMMREEGLEAVWARHRIIGQMVRAGVSATGLPLFATPEAASDTVTVVCFPDDAPNELSAFLANLRNRHGLVLAGGYGPIETRVFRIGHLGGIREHDVYRLLAALERGLVEWGLPAASGSVVTAARHVALTAGGPRPRPVTEAVRAEVRAAATSVPAISPTERPLMEVSR